jgi:hypothetical protein
MGTQNVTQNDFSTRKIADGTNNNLKITLKDIYGNLIIPAS